MPNNIYKLEVTLNDSTSKTTRADKQDPITGSKENTLTKQEKTQGFMDRVKNNNAFKVGGTIVGGAVVAGKEIYDYKLTSAQTLGYENKALRMQEGMKNVQRGATLLAGIGMVATGNPLGLVVIGYQALGLAKENREKIIDIQLDSITSQKQSQRLIYNTSQRSR